METDKLANRRPHHGIRAPLRRAPQGSVPQVKQLMCSVTVVAVEGLRNHVLGHGLVDQVLGGVVENSVQLEGPVCLLVIDNSSPSIFF